VPAPLFKRGIKIASEKFILGLPAGQRNSNNKNFKFGHQDNTHSMFVNNDLR
jgi:hypothetical protein